MKKKIFKFRNSTGLVIKGMTIGPATPDKSIGFIYLPGIVLGNTAVHRLGLDITKLLAGLGYNSLLFDQAGIGESEGDYPVGNHDELSAWVRDGNLVPDTLEAIDQFRKVTNVDRVALIGHCGGALTAMYSGARHHAVSGMFLISPPTVIAKHGGELNQKEVVDEYMLLYRNKLFSPYAWKRLFTGGSDYKILFGVVVNKIKGKFSALLRKKHPAKDTGKPVADSDVQFNPALVKAYKQANREKKHISVIFGDRDPDVNDFREFQRCFLSDDSPFSILQDTSHGFITEDSLKALHGELTRFASTVSTGR